MELFHKYEYIPVCTVTYCQIAGVLFYRNVYLSTEVKWLGLPLMFEKRHIQTSVL